LDVVYVWEGELPSAQECKRFCSADPGENRNLVVVREGVVVECYKGLPDELHNGLLRTVPLHPQGCVLPLGPAVERNIPLKVARAMRLILTRLTRSRWRAQVKAALGALDVLALRDALAGVDLRQLVAEPEVDADDRKSLAFQVGQTLALMGGVELYTKAELAAEFPDLAPLLGRAERGSEACGAGLDALEGHKGRWLGELAALRREKDGPRNILWSDGPREGWAAPFHAQCQGVVLDLKQERAASLKKGGLEDSVPQENHPTPQSS
jgi:hypothetical protein